jgi:hypothetical protein
MGPLPISQINTEQQWNDSYGGKPNDYEENCSIFVFKNLVPTSEKTQRVSITRINCVMCLREQQLFTLIIILNPSIYTLWIKCRIIEYYSRWHTDLPVNIKRLTTANDLSDFLKTLFLGRTLFEPVPTLVGI